MPLTLTIASYPNNEIRIRLAPPHAVRSQSESQDESSETHEESSIEVPDLLDISAELETHPQEPALKSGYGKSPSPSKFGTYARRQLLRVGGVLDKIDTNPQNGIFLTGTLPGSTDAAKQALANYSAYCVHRLKAWINKRMPSKLDFYVWELQARGALHLHYYVYCPEESQRSYIIEHFKQEWISILDSIVVLSGTDIYQRDENYSHVQDKSVIQAYAQTVNKSVAAYLSKYCSKQSSHHSDSHSIKYFPSRWWGASRPLLAKLREMSSVEKVEISSYRRARSQYEELVALLERTSIKGYAYGDKVGYGLNNVYYFSPDEHKLVELEVMSTFVPLSDLNAKETQQNLLQLQRVLRACEWHPGFNAYIKSNLSITAQNCAIALISAIPVNSFQAFALASEIEILSRVWAEDREHTNDRVKRIYLSSCSISSFFSNKILVEGEVDILNSTN